MQKIVVDIGEQTLSLFNNEACFSTYAISTGKNGVGEAFGSEKTPRGHHIIRAFVGAHYPENTVFVARRATGEVYSEELGKQFPNRDWILTRILWLSGKEIGKNRLSSCDTMRRYIYIHGTPDNTVLGKPGSRGCIRMRNNEIIELFDLVKPGTSVFINE